MRLLFVGLVLGSVLTAPTLAQSTNGGNTWDDGGYGLGVGGEGGCCGKAVNDLIKNRPDEQQAAALQLFKDLYVIDEEHLAYLKARGDQVCSDVNCKEMEPALVQQLVGLAADRKQRNEANQIASESNRVAWFGLFAAIASAVIGLIALLFSWRSNKQSHRNEAAIERLQGK
jgi:hypothetical protein